MLAQIAAAVALLFQVGYAPADAISHTPVEVGVVQDGALSTSTATSVILNSARLHELTDADLAIVLAHERQHIDDFQHGYVYSPGQGCDVMETRAMVQQGIVANLFLEAGLIPPPWAENLYEKDSLFIYAQMQDPTIQFRASLDPSYQRHCYGS